MRVWSVWTESQSPCPVFIIDSSLGYCSMGGGALPFNSDFYFRDSLYKRCPVKIHIDNDAKCAALAEATIGSLKDVEDGFVLLFGTMIGGAFVKGGEVHRGRHFSAGEVSYIHTAGNSLPDLENAWGIRCGVPRLLEDYAERSGKALQGISGEELFDAAEAGDEVSLACLRDYTRDIAVQIFNLQNILDPERFAIGGGISRRPLFIELIRESLDEIYASFPLPLTRAELVRCAFMNNANLIGAVQGLLKD